MIAAASRHYCCFSLFISTHAIFACLAFSNASPKMLFASAAAPAPPGLTTFAMPLQLLPCQALSFYRLLFRCLFAFCQLSRRLRFDIDSHYAITFFAIDDIYSPHY
jgi:hypothetical protein